MSDSSRGPQFPRRLLEKEAKRILDRALELDHVNGPHMSMENLRTIARELGISDEALETAMQETLDADAAHALRATPTPVAHDFAEPEGWFSRWWGGRRQKWSAGLEWLTKLSLPIGLLVGVVGAKLAQDSVFGRSDGATFMLLLGAAWAILIALRPARSTPAQMVSLSFLFWLGLTIGGDATGLLVFGSARAFRFITNMSATSFVLSVSLGLFVTLLVAMIKQFMPRGSSSRPFAMTAQ